MKKNKFLGSVVIFSLGSMIMNGLIVYFILISRNQTGFSLESISLHTKSPVGISLYAALVLTIFFSAIYFAIAKMESKKAGIVHPTSLLQGSFWPDVFVIVLQNSIFAFGLIVIIIELLQTQLPFGAVGIVTASAIAGFISFVITGMTLYTTFDTILSKNQ
jgi:hypothetical protein